MPLATSAPSNHERTFADKQQHRQTACGKDDLGARGDQRTHLFDELPANPLVGCFVGECAHEAGQIHLNGPHADHALVEAMSLHLPLVPLDEPWIDGHKADPAAHAVSAANRLASPRPMTGMSTRAADFQEAGLLEMPDDECVISGALRLQRVADGLCGATEFRERMKVLVGRVEAVHLEFEIRGSDRVE